MSSSGDGAEKLKLFLVRWNINFFGILCSTTHSESFQIASAVFDSCKSLHQIEFFSFVTRGICHSATPQGKRTFAG